MKNKIYDIYWDLIGWRLREFKRSITNLIVWFPLIWKDRHWDDMYIFDILQFKLKNQAKYISDRDFHLNAKRDGPWVVHMFHKHHDLDGPTNLTINRIGFGFGYFFY